MTSLDQIQREIQTLPQEALELLAVYIQLLKRATLGAGQSQDAPPETAELLPEGSVYERFQASGLIGCMSSEDNLSTTYKQILAEDWKRKYDHC